MASRELIQEITKSIVALMVLAGGGAVVFAQPDSPIVPFATALMGSVVGYYLNANTTAQIEKAAKTAALSAVQGVMK